MLIDTPHDRRALRRFLAGELTEAQIRAGWGGAQLGTLLDAEHSQPSEDPGPGHWDQSLDLRTEAAPLTGTFTWGGSTFIIRNHATSTCPSGPCGSRVSVHRQPRSLVTHVLGHLAVCTPAPHR